MKIIATNGTLLLSLVFLQGAVEMRRLVKVEGMKVEVPDDE